MVNFFERKEMIMNNYERMIPRSFKPISAWGYVGYSLLYALPIVGFIFAIINAIGATNRNVRSYARSWFCGLLISLIVLVVVVGVLTVLILNNVITKDMWNEYIDQVIRDFTKNMQSAKF